MNIGICRSSKASAAVSVTAMIGSKPRKTKAIVVAVIEAMKDHDAVLLSNHGQVVCGRDFDEVLERALFFEMACRVIVQSRMDYTVLSRKDVEDLWEHL